MSAILLYKNSYTKPELPVDLNIKSSYILNSTSLFLLNYRKAGHLPASYQQREGFSFSFIPSAFMIFVTVGACNPVAVNWMKNRIVLKCQMIRQLVHLTRTCKLWIQTLLGRSGVAQMHPSQASTLNKVRCVDKVHFCV